MTKRTTKKVHSELDRPDEVFNVAAELFKILSTPMRLKILSCLRDGEQNVSYLLSHIETTQPNMSQHLNALYKSGVLGRRREGVQILYRITDERVADLCRAVCTHVETKE
jgi:ArsR family transcriptional regulator